MSQGRKLGAQLDYILEPYLFSKLIQLSTLLYRLGISLRMNSQYDFLRSSCVHLISVLFSF